MSAFARCLAFLAASAAIGLGGGCASVDIDAVHCSVTGDLPHESSGRPGFIVSKGRVKCVGDGRITSVKASVKIQRKISGTWKDVPDTVSTRTVAPVKLGERYTIQNRDLKCRRGTFRTAVKINAVVKGKSVQLTGGGWGYSKEKVNPCG